MNTTQQEAERSVIGAALIEAGTIRSILEHVTPDDFYDVTLGNVFSLIIEMAGAGKGTDALTVASTAKDRKITGVTPASLFELVEGTPTAANASFYAQIVAEAASKRRLWAAGTRMAQAASSDVSAADAMNIARDAWSGVSSPVSNGLDAPTLGTLLEGEDNYDWIIPNLMERRDRLVLTGGEGAGKALALDTEIPTPSGWTTMADLNPGDYVLGADGKPTRILAVTDVMHDRECFRVEFSDGTHVVADAEHQWMTETYASRIRTAAQARRGATKPHGTDQRGKRRHFPAVITTREIADTLHARGGHTLNHSIPAAAPLDLPSADLPLSPYVLGAWLGDGHTAEGRITIGEEDREAMTTVLETEGWPANPQSGKYLYGIRGLKVALRAIGVLGRKHIPAAYLRGSFDQRLALLQGLMDTDGTVSSGVAPRCEFSVVDQRLATDVHELVLSLGIIATIRESDATLNGLVVGRRWRIGFRTELPVFQIPRKLERIKPLRTARSRHRFVTAVIPVESVPVRCIQVDNADRMYLAGRQMVPTHNSTFVRQIAIASAAGIHPLTFEPMTPLRVLVVDAENSEKQWRRKAAGLANQAARHGAVDPRETVRISCVSRLDITTERDLSAVHALIDAHKPDLVAIGPLYKLVPRAITNDDDAAPLIDALDSLRARGVALVMEAHAGHGQSGSGVRDLRPRGSAALLGWPEFGMGLQVDRDNPRRANLVRWRGDRDERAWPDQIERGSKTGWPWADADGFATAQKYDRATQEF